MVCYVTIKIDSSYMCENLMFGRYLFHRLMEVLLSNWSCDGEVSCVVFLKCIMIGCVSLARENEAGGSWGQKVHILHVNV